MCEHFSDANFLTNVMHWQNDMYSLFNNYSVHSLIVAQSTHML